MFKKLKKLLRVVILLAVLLFAAKFLIAYFLKPTYSGTLALNNLKHPVEIYYDDYGIPHIYADNEEDAQRALGYAHAQDRLWQMELLRRISPGKLSELFGEIALENDLFFAGLCIDEASKTSIANLDKNSKTYKMATAYLDGINEFIEKGPTPIEFTILGIEKRKFDLKDTYNIFGYMAFSFANAQKTDPVLSYLQAKLGNEYIKELGLEVDINSTLIKNFNPDAVQIASTVNNILKKSPVPSFIGSNSWIVGGQKTKSGKPLFANDPHIEYSSPSVWFEAHVVTPNYESYGHYLGGVPFPVLMHNRNLAYGLTMFENDDIDFYQEENHPTDANQYKTKDGYKTYEIIEKTIKVKDGNDQNIRIKKSQHGPVMNDFVKTIKNDNPIAISWIFTQLENKGLEALYTLSHATNKAEFEKGAALIHAPGLNLTYVDDKDNLAWIAVGKLYKLPENVSSKLILDGASGENEIVEFLDFSENPQAHDPTWNYVYSANNQPDSIAGMLYPGYYLPEDRAKRIVELIEPKNDWTVDDFKKMFSDSQSPNAQEFVTILAQNIEATLNNDTDKKALSILKNWDGNFVKSSVGATIYSKFVYYFLKETFEDEMTQPIFIDFINTHIMKRELKRQMRKENSIWWDDIATENKQETKAEILTVAFQKTVAKLEEQLGENMDNWQWKRMHHLTFNHPLGSVKMLDKLFGFSVGPFEVDGSNEVINNQMFDITNEALLPVKAGPSTRRIVDFSNIDNSYGILPTGNSGNVFSPFYKDQANMFINGEFRKMRMNKTEIEQVSSKLVLEPKN